MTLFNWLGLALTAIIIAVSIALHLYFRNKFYQLGGVEGFVAERGKLPRRADFDWEKAEVERLERELAESDGKAIRYSVKRKRQIKLRLYRCGLICRLRSRARLL